MLTNAVVLFALLFGPALALVAEMRMNPTPIRQRIARAFVAADPDPTYSRLDRFDGLRD
ncbi:hypothetical protein [Frondihabitans sp. VKM Ac-2883]|uniref:hypothetical protein n=1 Tax=Frondihabitans sp. VKM Ac-2883 TaxID=2783823 RepID=UPI00188BCEF5|nr:hypothetical protein [Frondihabitans sp. VKM Ac-2883]MBF4574713.1 hypothetical protein [Frondihabitans sp. VKM Ac-2883]